jgi:hypothetical protein
MRHPVVDDAAVLPALTSLSTVGPPTLSRVLWRPVGVQLGCRRRDTTPDYTRSPSRHQRASITAI